MIIQTSLTDSDELDSNCQRQSGSAYDAGGGRLWVLRLMGRPWVGRLGCDGVGGGA